MKVKILTLLNPMVKTCPHQKKMRAPAYFIYIHTPKKKKKKQFINELFNAGSAKQIGNLVYKAPRNGPTLWEIGIPDRSAAEFYIPNPNPKYINKLYVKHDRLDLVLINLLL